MQFDSFTFLLFFMLVLAGAASTRGWGARKNLLLLASYLFYGAWSPAFTLLLAGASVIDWFLARRIHAAATHPARRFWLAASIVLNIGTLALFKYGPFLHANLAVALAAVGVQIDPWSLGLVLPVGISFYTFQSVSYTFDVYRRRVEPIHSLRDFCLFVAFFPQLVAGPIVRFTQFAPQLVEPRAPSWPGLAHGAVWMLWGLFEKIVLADTVFAPVADAAWSNLAGLSSSSALAASLAFAGQIFCDFAGYSCCAIGAARCLGFDLPPNFRNPYAAVGFSDFWKRWHISLSTWLRDYLYIALGGNRGGVWRTYRNLMLTMLLGGLWHGAGWNFVVWGGCHGLLLVLERRLRGERDGATADPRGLSRGVWAVVTLLAVVALWIPFRSPDFAATAQFLQAFARPWTPLDFGAACALAAFALIVLAQWRVRDLDLDALVARAPAALLVPFLALLLVLIVLSPGDTHAFIYFQF
ncbi:MAG TPA: MBOAT family O-acyltransferase [Pseudomonadota bacterium]|nr:MBOAT family O-acyltransferase [Pseudomonadota bacterium]